MNSPVALPDLPQLQLVALAPCGRIYTRLPKMWPGFVLVALCLALELIRFVDPSLRHDPDDPFFVFIWIAGMLGSCYWLFCVHRIHKVLAEYSNGTYPISARRAVLLQFVPIFEFYWFFRWTRQLERYLDERGHPLPIPTYLPGLLLTAASLLGFVPPIDGLLVFNSGFKILRLILLFGLGRFLLRQLRPALPPCKPIPIRRWQQWNLAAAAGIGAAFCLCLVIAIAHFFTHHEPSEQKIEFESIVLVSIGMLIFLEPIFERVRVRMGLDSEPHDHVRQSIRLRVLAFAVLVVTNIFHTAAEHGIEHFMKDESRPVVILLASILVAGGITYFWIAAAHHHPSHAARSGLLSGAILGLIVTSTVITVAARFSHPAEVSSDPFNTASAVSKAVPIPGFEIPFASPKMLDDLLLGHFTKPLLMIFLPWPIFGLVGGLAIDRRWLGKVHSVALATFAAALVYALILKLTGQVDLREMIFQLAAAAGWGLALVVCSASPVLMPQEASDPVHR